MRDGVEIGGIRGPNPKPFSEESDFCLCRVEHNPRQSGVGEKNWEWVLEADSHTRESRPLHLLDLSLLV